MDILSGESPLQQLVLVILLLIVLFFILATLEYLYIKYFEMTYSRVSLLENTAISSNSMITVTQDPTKNGSKTMLVSDNERSGIEFSYSFFLNVNSDTFTGTADTTLLKHVFHKGYAKPYPLLGPGVFILNNTNTMRIHMNSFSNWSKHIDIENIPIDKWFHAAIIYRNAAIEVYINGNLFKKMAFLKGDLPYQNFQNLYIFNRYNGSMNASSIPAINEAKTNGLVPDLTGQMSGSISRLNYFRYALGFSEIQALMNEGPSSKVEKAGNNRITPYLQDTWWTTTY